MESINIWGITINPVSKKEIVSSIHKMLDLGRKGIQITGVNPETIVKAQYSSILHDSIVDSDIVNIDNLFVLLMLQFKKIRVIERCATPDVFRMLIRGAVNRQESVYFLGAEQEVLERMIKKMRIVYPTLNVVGYRNGFFSESEEKKIVNEIKELHPTYLFLGLPTPQKEVFIMKYKKDLEVGVLYGVGGVFDILGGKVKRAPDWLCRIGMEGIIRVLQNPKNYGSRVLKYYPTFIKMSIKHK